MPFLVAQSIAENYNLEANFDDEGRIYTDAPQF